MDGVDRVQRRKTLKERLGFKTIGCCGATLGLSPFAVRVGDDDEAPPQPPTPPLQQLLEDINGGRTRPANGCVPQIPAASASGMNLATALAAERSHRAAQESGGNSGLVSPVRLTNERPSNGTAGTALVTPSRVSLMRLMVETDGGAGQSGAAERENDSVCCVCMGRKKGAAFIPCGHTYCRVCTRELWLNRGSCPLCNRQVLEILDIY
ncbi:putative E3 ubiquitin-protein ligase XBAT35 isoform X2 [Diospyros lotus]|nr:putative E3 ubiquitin-protein ligase XBAT35 isoform X2 [Diospyros lotus]